MVGDPGLRGRIDSKCAVKERDDLKQCRTYPPGCVGVQAFLVADLLEECLQM